MARARPPTRTRSSSGIRGHGALLRVGRRRTLRNPSWRPVLGEAAFQPDDPYDRPPPASRPGRDAGDRADARRCASSGRGGLASAAAGAAGRVSDPKVVESGGAEFDDAALTAVNRWVFSPAEESGKPIASRIRVPFSFHLPPASPAGAPPLPPSSPATAQPPVPPGATAAQPVEAPAKKEE